MKRFHLFQGGSIAVAVAMFGFGGAVLADTKISYDTATGRTLTGTWAADGGNGYAGTQNYSGPGASSGTAAWVLTGLAGGTYRVYAKWTINANRTTDAAYTVNSNPVLHLSQRSFDEVRFYDGATWASLGSTADSSGTITVGVGNNTSADYLIADAVRVGLNDPPCSVLGTTTLGNVIAIDNKDPGFSTTGTWENFDFGGFLKGGDGKSGRLNRISSGTATWTANNLPDGIYRVSATYAAQSWGNVQALYTLSTGQSKIVNQSTAPSDIASGAPNSGKVSWVDLGVNVLIAGGTFSVTLSPNATGTHNTQADAIRLEMTQALPKGTIVSIR